MARGLSTIDEKVWRFLFEACELGEGSPSGAEIARGCYCSRPAVWKALDKLEGRGYIRWKYLGDRRAARGLLSVLPPYEVRDRLREKLHKKHLSREELEQIKRDKNRDRMRVRRGRDRGKISPD